MSQVRQNLDLAAYLGADHWEEIECFDAETGLPVIWSDFNKITFTVRQPSEDGNLGARVCTVNSVDNPEFFRIFPGSTKLELNTSNLPGLELGPKYEALLKGHDAVRVKGQILGNYTPDTHYPNIFLTAAPGY